MFKAHYHAFARLGLKTSRSLVGYDVGLELRCGLLPSICDLSQRIIRRHLITILIRGGGNGSPLCYPQKYKLNGTWRMLHPRRILHALDAISINSVFRQVSFERWSFSPEPSTPLTWLHRLINIDWLVDCCCCH